MKATTILCVLALIAGALAAAQPRDYEGYTFAHFQGEFKKAYTSTVALKYRENIFYANLAKVRAVNAQYAAGKKSYFLAVNKFADMTDAEMARYRGFNFGQSQKSKVVTGADLKTTDLPAAVDWRTKGVVTDVKDQGGCGSCWTFSTAETLESHIAIKTGQLLVFSEQQIVSCATNPQKCGGTGGCEGATQEIAFNYTRDAGGISLETSYPYQGADSACDPSQVKPVATIDGYVRLDSNNATQLTAAIANVGPIAISLAASGFSFQLYGGGVLSGDGCGWDIDHAVQAVGYGYDTSVNMGFWLVRNSWGAGWGEAGYVRIFRQSDGKTPEQCGTDTTPGDGDGCPDGPSSITVCGECGILSDSSYPYGGRLV